MSGLRFSAVIGTEYRAYAAYRSRRFDYGSLYDSCMYGLWISVRSSTYPQIFLRRWRANIGFCHAGLHA